MQCRLRQHPSGCRAGPSAALSAGDAEQAVAEDVDVTRLHGLALVRPQRVHRMAVQRQRARRLASPRTA